MDAGQRLPVEGNDRKQLDKLAQRGEVLGAPADLGGVLRGRGIEVEVAAAGLAKRRVEQHQARVVPALGGRQQRGQRRQGMEYPYRGFLSVGRVDRFQNAVLVVGQRGHVVPFRRADLVPAVVPQVMDDDIELIGEQRPEGIVQVDRKTVAVSQYEPGAVRIAMPPEHDDRVVVHAHVMSGMRPGQHPARLVQARQRVGLLRQGRAGSALIAGRPKEIRLVPPVFLQAATQPCCLRMQQPW